MTVVYFDSPMSDDERRAKLFGGDLFVYSPTPNSRALVDFAQKMSEEAFAPHFPPDAQHHLDGQAYVDVLAMLKPTFINHARSKELVPRCSTTSVPTSRRPTSMYRDFAR